MHRILNIILLYLLISYKFLTLRINTGFYIFMFSQIFIYNSVWVANGWQFNICFPHAYNLFIIIIPLRQLYRNGMTIIIYTVMMGDMPILIMHVLILFRINYLIINISKHWILHTCLNNIFTLWLSIEKSSIAVNNKLSLMLFFIFV